MGLWPRVAVPQRAHTRGHGGEAAISAPLHPAYEGLEKLGGRHLLGQIAT